MMMQLSPEIGMTSIHKPHSDGTRNSGGWENNNPQLRRSHSYKMKGERMSLHLDTRMWLKTLDLEEYGTLFMSYPYVETLLHFTEKDLQGLGISNAAHRARLSSNIVFIREKLKCSSNGYHQLTNRPKRFSCGNPPASPTDWTINQYRYSTIPELGTLQQVTPPVRKKMELKDSSPEELRRELEEELKLPNDDVRSHAWFHGGISREKAEKQIRENGDFLVRDSISRPGSFVLSVYWRSTPMHFVINRVVVQHDTPYATVQYQFEKECFSCIPSLVRFYVGNCKPVSQVSGAVIQRPVNRTVPLSYIDSKYAEFNKVQGNVNHIYCAVPKKVKTPKLLIGSPLRQRCESQPSILISKPEMMERSGSQPLLDTTPNGFHQQLPLRSDDDHRPLERTGSEPVLSPTFVRRSFGSLEPDYMETKPHFGSDSKISVKENPPGKPVRALDVREHHYQEIPTADQSVQLTRLHDHDTTTPQTFIYTSENDHQLNEEKPRQRIFSDTRDSTLDCNYSMMGRDITPYEKQLPRVILPIEETSSMFQPLELKTSFFGSDNKPLEASAMIAVKRMLLEEDPLLLAKHLTSVDLEVCRILNPGCNTLPGLELITLPPGRQLRRDLMERYNCIKTWLSIILLTTVEKDTRVKLLSQWILIAECLRTNMGNMFGFAAIMDGLGSKQVCNLKQTWEGLRTTFTSIAVTYETKLRSLLKSLNAGENVIPLTKTCIPHVIPLVQLLERDWSVLESQDWSQPVSQNMLDSLPQGESWEESTASFGMDPLVNHLQNAHLFVQQIKLFHINADLKLQKFLPDDDMLDICRTDFHLRLLWGSKGALVNREERYRKFDRVLTVMSEKLESVVLPVSYSK